MSAVKKVLSFELICEIIRPLHPPSFLCRLFTVDTPATLFLLFSFLALPSFFTCPPLLIAPGQHSRHEAFSGRYAVVYLTPEMLPFCLEDIVALHRRGVAGEGGGVGLLAVDEAHCISQWGQDFRAAFLELHCFRDHPALASIPLMALTATAVPRVQADLKRALRLAPDCLESITSVDR